MAMASAPDSYFFPRVPPPPPPGHPISPPPPPGHLTSPPPPPHIIPPPPPHVFPPPPPHVFPPPPPHVTPVPPHVVPPPPPPLPPDNHPIVIVIVIVSFGSLLFLACLFALCCFLKKRKRKIAKTHDEIVKVDEHLKIKEAIEEGPHGKKAVLLSVEDDVHMERRDIDEMKKKESLGQENMHEKSAEITPRALEEGISSSSPEHHLFCFLKKWKKKIPKTHNEIVKVDEHLKIKEAIEEGPHGKNVVALSVEDDVHTERIDKDEIKKKESLGQEKMHEKTAEITPALEEGRSSSSPEHHHLERNS